MYRPILELQERLYNGNVDFAVLNARWREGACEVLIHHVTELVLDVHWVLSCLDSAILSIIQIAWFIRPIFMTLPSRLIK